MDQEMVEQTTANQDGFFNDLLSSQAACSVRVALRMRPLLPREIFENSRICVDVNREQNTVTIGKDRVFTFDKTFDMMQSQQEVFEVCVKNLVLGCFSGFNATVLAYGQTGSGKTYTMGSGFTLGVKEEDLGIIPRVIRLIFEEEQKRRDRAEFLIKCSFLEIYNEELIDLLDQGLIEKMIPQKKEISIREEKNGAISVFGLNEVRVRSSAEMANCLDLGSTARRTASTLMNQASSRSHGIFTITIEQHLIEDLVIGEILNQSEKPNEFTVAKFHFVDLAGSERAKRTGATGSILKEGININKSLLALGNVISALTDDQKKQNHIPYRDSKLTRILQDSLGGNSRTSMIACCSPAESSFEETLNTLKYASRARNIKNKPVVNRDPASQQILELRQQVYELQKELVFQRKVLIQNGIQIESQMELPPELNEDATTLIQTKTNSQEQTRMLEAIITDLRKQIQTKDHQLAQLEIKITDLKANCDQSQISQYEHLKERDEVRIIAEQLAQRLKELGHTPVTSLEKMTSVVDEYRQKNINIEREAVNLRQMLQHLQVDNQQLIEQSLRDTKLLEAKQVELEKQRRFVENQKGEINRLNQELKRATAPKNAFTSERLPPIQSATRKEKDENWLSSDLDHKIKHFDNLRQRFIENLGDQMSHLLGGMGSTSLDNAQNLNSLHDQNESHSMGYISEENSSSQDDDENQLSGGDQDHRPVGVDPAKILVEEQQLIQTERNISSLDDQLRDKEALLTSLKQTQLELQDNLLLAMKEEYHKRVESLNKELIRLEQQKSFEITRAQGAQKSRIEDQFKMKQQELQNQLQIIAKKEKETKQMQKALEEQQKRVKTLESDLHQMKTQRVMMLKKAKDDQEKLNKFKFEQQKELQKLRLQVMKKDRENNELKRDAKKKEIFAKRKLEELNAIQGRQRVEQQKRQNATQQRQGLKQVDLDQISDWIVENTLKMLDYQELQNEREVKDEEFQKIESEILQLQGQYAQVSVAKERVDQQICLCDPLSHRAQNLEALQASYNQQIDEMREQLEILDSKQRFINSQILALIKQLEQMRPDPIDSKVMQNVQSLEGARACISIFFKHLLDVNLIRIEVQKERDYLETKIHSLQSQLDEVTQFNDTKHKYHEKELEECNMMLKNREKFWFDMILSKTGVNPNEVEEGDIEKLLQVCFRKKKQEQPQTQKISKVTSKSPDARMQRAPIKTVQPTSLKDARNARKIQKAGETSSDQQQPRVQHYNEDSDIIDRYDSHQRPSSIHNDVREYSQIKTDFVFQNPFKRVARQVYFLVDQNCSVSSNNEAFPEQKNWQIMSQNQEAHKSSIQALASLENSLYSGATKSLKIWNIEQQKCVSELTDMGIVKAIKISTQRKLLIVAADKFLIMWDLVGLTKISEFKAEHEIKCLELSEGGDLLFAGTKSTGTSVADPGALLIFDLKKSLKKLVTADDKYKNQEINCFASTNEYLFMGCGQGNITPFEFSNWQVMNPISYNSDSTALAILQGTLVSGHKDKCLRTYSTKSVDQHTVKKAHKESINCMETDFNNSGLYSGGSDGIVKVWRHSNTFGLRCTAQLEANLSHCSVNSLCKLDYSRYGDAFACGNTDKSIRIWRSQDQTQINEVDDLDESSALTQLQIHKKKKMQRINNDLI